jgi:hypothetical protein
MNENIPTPPPADPEPNRPPPTPDERPGFWAMFGLGIGLLVVSCILCGLFQHPFPLLIGALGAFGSLFSSRYRGIFIGYVSTIGIALLVTAVICGAMIAGHR